MNLCGVGQWEEQAWTQTNSIQSWCHSPTLDKRLLWALASSPMKLREQHQACRASVDAGDVWAGHRGEFLKSNDCHHACCLAYQGGRTWLPTVGQFAGPPNPPGDLEKTWALWGYPHPGRVPISLARCWMKKITKGRNSLLVQWLRLELLGRGYGFTPWMGN